MQSVISPVSQGSDPALGHSPRFTSWIMGLTGLKNNLVCVPGIILTWINLPAHLVQFRGWGDPGPAQGWVWCLQPPLPTQGTKWPHLPLKTILSCCPETSQLGNWGWRDFLPTQGPAAAKLVWWWLLFSSRDRNAKGMLEFGAVMFLSLCLLC